MGLSFFPFGCQFFHRWPLSIRNVHLVSVRVRPLMSVVTCDASSGGPSLFDQPLRHFPGLPSFLPSLGFVCLFTLCRPLPSLNRFPELDGCFASFSPLAVAVGGRAGDGHGVGRRGQRTGGTRQSARNQGARHEEPSFLPSFRRQLTLFQFTPAVFPAAASH